MRTIKFLCGVSLFLTACGEDAAVQPAFDEHTGERLAALESAEVADSDAAARESDAACSRSLTSSTVALNEVTLRVTEQGCGRTIVMLHGFPMYGFSWEPLQARLAKKFRVIAPDQRGYPPSSSPADVSMYTISKLVDDTAQLINAVTHGSRRRVFLVGHDWGGILAWVFASQHPEMLRGLIVINGAQPDIFIRQIQTDPAQAQSSAYIELFRMPGVAEQVLSADNFGLLINSIHYAITPALEDRFRAAWGQPDGLTGGLNWYRANFASGSEWVPDFPRNVRVSVPTLVVWGLQDQVTLPGNLVGLENYASDLTLHTLPNVGHFPMYEATDEVASAIRSFAHSH